MAQRTGNLWNHGCSEFQVLCRLWNKYRGVTRQEGNKVICLTRSAWLRCCGVCRTQWLFPCRNYPCTDTDSSAGAIQLCPPSPSVVAKGLSELSFVSPSLMCAAFHATASCRCSGFTSYSNNPAEITLFHGNPSNSASPSHPQCLVHKLPLNCKINSAKEVKVPSEGTFSLLIIIGSGKRLKQDHSRTWKT